MGIKETMKAQNWGLPDITVFHSSGFPSYHLGIVYSLNLTVLPTLSPHPCPPPLWLPLLACLLTPVFPHVEINKCIYSRSVQSGSYVMVIKSGMKMRWPHLLQTALLTVRVMRDSLNLTWSSLGCPSQKPSKQINFLLSLLVVLSWSPLSWDHH